MNARFFTLVAIVFGVALFRYLPHPPNVSPIAAMALFGGATFSNRRDAFLLPFLALFVGDLFIGFHVTMAYVYGAFGLTVLMGFALRGRMRTTSIAVAVLGSSLMFFLLTNFGAWATSAMYPKTASGLMQAYVEGIPFFQNTLLGNAAFALLLFGAYELLQRSLVWMRPNSVSHS